MKNLGRDKYEWSAYKTDSVEECASQEDAVSVSEEPLELLVEKEAVIAPSVSMTTNPFGDLEKGLMIAANSPKSEHPAPETKSFKPKKPLPKSQAKKPIKQEAKKQEDPQKDLFESAHIASMVDKLSGDNLYVKAAAELLSKPRSSWSALSFKLDKDVLLARMGHSEYAFEKLLANFSTGQLLAIEETIGNLLDERKNEAFKKLIDSYILKIQKTVNSLVELDYPSDKIESIRNNIIEQVNEKLPDRCPLITLNDVLEAEIVEVNESSGNTGLTITPSLNDSKPSYARSKKEKGLQPATYKLNINGEECYIAEKSMKSLIYKYIVKHTNLNIEDFKNHDNNPPYFLSTYQSQKLRRNGIMAKLKEACS